MLEPSRLNPAPPPKNAISRKKNDLFDFTSFIAWTFLYFLARCALQFIKNCTIFPFLANCSGILFTFRDAIGNRLDIDTGWHSNFLEDLFGLDEDMLDKIVCHLVLGLVCRFPWDMLRMERGNSFRKWKPQCCYTIYHSNSTPLPAEVENKGKFPLHMDYLVLF